MKILKKERSDHYNLENIADLLWLADHMTIENKEHSDDLSSKCEHNRVENLQIHQRKEQTSRDEKEKYKKPVELEVHRKEDKQISGKTISQKSAKAFQSPKKIALPHYREWEKAFKYINLKSIALHSDEVDEEATAEYIASSQIFDVKFKQNYEKKYSLTIVIDQNSTMTIWRELISQFIDMIPTMGVFKQIDIFYWDTTGKTAQLFYDKELKQKADDKSIIKDNKYKVVWILSDCLALSWQSGDGFKKIKFWSQTLFVSILHMFPKYMWMGTMLYKLKQTALSSKSAVETNSQLLMNRRSSNTPVAKIPVVSFNPFALQAWARVLVNRPQNSISGVLFEEGLSFEVLEQKQLEISADDRVKRFLTQATQTAQTLAFYLSVLPVDFQVVRILQEQMFPKSDQSHIAELFLGGIIQRIEEDEVTKYEFYPEVREKLNQNITAKESIEILKKMSEFLTNYLGSGFDIEALISAPDTILKGDIPLSYESIAYAKIVANILQRAGGRYKEIAIQITESLQENEELEKNKTKAIIPHSKRFQMGSNEYDIEKPVHEVVFNYDFEIAQYPVTVGEFRAFVKDTDYKTEAEIGDGAYVWDGKDIKKKKDVYWDNPYFEQTEEHPVVCVSWNDAKEYCKWLSKKTGENYRLPTEAEWEYACRAGTTTKWSFGDDEKELEKYAWYDENSGGKTHPVGEKEPNPWGLYDMHGNVWEWCEDDFIDDYEETPRDGSAYQDKKSDRKVLRGGSWDDVAGNTRSSYRDWGDPAYRDVDVGFRLLRTLPFSFGSEASASHIGRTEVVPPSKAPQGEEEN